MKVAIAGLDEIENLYRSAADGVFTIEADTARRCADVVQTLIDGLQTQRPALRNIDYGMFGQFDSAQQMASGFATKAEHLQQLLAEYIEAATRLKASFELAGALVADVEADNSASLLRSEGGSR